MKDELYKKVYIKTEADLPEEVGKYPVHQKGFESDYVMSMYYSRLLNNFWVQAYDWYLLPFKQENKTAIEQVREAFEPIQLEQKSEEQSADNFMQHFSQQSRKNEISDILKCIFKFDDTESLENKGRYFEVIQKDVRNLNPKP